MENFFSIAMVCCGCAKLPNLTTTTTMMLLVAAAAAMMMIFAIDDIYDIFI